MAIYSICVFFHFFFSSSVEASFIFDIILYSLLAHYFLSHFLSVRVFFLLFFSSVGVAFSNERHVCGEMRHTNCCANTHDQVEIYVLLSFITSHVVLQNIIHMKHDSYLNPKPFSLRVCEFVCLCVCVNIVMCSGMHRFELTPYLRRVPLYGFCCRLVIFSETAQFK